jgi:hypothetical protein
MLLHVGLNLVVEIFHDALERFGDPTQAGIGPSPQLYLKPLIKLKEVKAFDLDDPSLPLRREKY